MYTKEVRSNERSNEQTIHRLLQEKKKEIKAEIRFSRVALVLIENDIPRGNGKENIARPRTRFHIARQIVIVRAYGRRFWCKWAVLLMLRRRQDEARGCTWVQHARLAAVSFGRATCLSYETVAWETTILHCCLHTCLCVYVCVCPRISVPLRNYRAEHWCRSWCCCASSSFVSHVVYDTLFRIYLFIHVAATGSSSGTTLFGLVSICCLSPTIFGIGTVAALSLDVNSQNTPPLLSVHFRSQPWSFMKALMYIVLSLNASFQTTLSKRIAL